MKKVLMITYYWPPAGGAGVQRVLKFAKYLPEFGWEPVVLTVENPDCPVIDKTLLNDIPPGCKVYKTKSFEPFDLYKKLTGKSEDYKIPSDVLTQETGLTFAERVSKWIRFNLFIPDAKIGWSYNAIKAAKRIIENENIDVLFSTAPPPTVAFIGKKVAEKNGLKWVADFRDPWMEIVHYQNIKRSGITKFIDSKLEKSVLSNADIILTISRDIVNIFKSKLSDKNYSIIPNGFDETDFPVTEKITNNNCTIAYTGVITKTRVPYNFLKAFHKVVHVDKLNNIKFVIAGKTCKEFIEEVEKYDLGPYIENMGFVSHHKSTKILVESDILLLVIDDVPNNKGFLTGKIFEYLGSKTPIYAVGPLNGEANQIIIESDSGKMVDYRDEYGSYELLKQMYSQWNENNFSYKFNVDNYSRKSQTKELTEIFEELIK